MRGANVRAEPDTAAEIVGRLAEDDDVTVTGKVRGKDWYRVTLADERVGYVSAPLLAEVDPLEIGAWQALKAKPTLERVNAFLGAYPDSRYASKAKTLQSKLRSGKKTPSLGPLIEDALLAAQRNPDQPRARNLHDLVQSIAPKPDWLEAAPTKVQAHYQRCLADITVSYLSTAELGVYDAVVRGEADISQFDGNKFERILQSRSGGTQDLRQKFIETCPDDLLDIARYAPQ